MEILGLLEALESLVLDSFKVPLTGKVLIEEEKILALVDKIRLVCQRGDDFAKRSIEKDKRILRKGEAVSADESVRHAPAAGTALAADGSSEVRTKEEADAMAVEIIQQAYQLAKEVRLGADKYADEVLANLEATSTRILRTIRNGRTRLTQSAQTVSAHGSVAQTQAAEVETAVAA